MKINISKSLFLGIGGYLFPKRKSKSIKDEFEINELFNSQEDKINSLKQRCESLESENLVNQEHLLTLEIEKVDIVKQFDYEKSMMNQDFQMMKYENEQLTKKLMVFGNIPELPKDLSSVVNLIGKVQSDKLIFLPESMKSSKESKFQDVCPSWSLLWKMSTVLWNLLFEEELDRTTIEKEFKNQTGFGLTFGDGKMTNRDSKFQLLRKRNYNGNEIDITPHCKLDKSKGQLRIHFYLDYTKKVIVVGHCGDHLENYMSLNK